MKTVKYKLKNIDCAHCAAKMEEKINELDGVEKAVIVFSSKQLHLTAENPESFKKAINKICSSIDEGAGIEDDEYEKSVKTRILPTAVGAVIFISAIILSSMKINLLPSILYIISYLILGSKIIIKSVKNIASGHIFDENFLMSIATIGAFIIGEYAEGVGVMLFFRIGEIFEGIAVNNSRKRITDAVDMRPETADVLRNGQYINVKAEDVVPGDIITVKPGDRIPLDGTVTESSGRVDTSAITGEPTPILVGKGKPVLSGYINLSSQLKIRVDKPLTESMVTKILNSVENAAASKPKTEAFITKFAKIYTPVVVAVTAFTALIIPLITGGDFRYWIYTALTFLVMSCPCALVLSVPLAFFCGIGKASTKGILFKGGLIIESLAKIKNIAFDKTGTLTKGTFDVEKVITAGAVSENEIIHYAASCETISNHPIAESILNYAKKNNISVKSPETAEEIPGNGIKAVIDGNEILCGNSIFTEIDKENEEGTQIYLKVNNIYYGKIIISDIIKPDAEYAVKQLKNMHINTFMLTGDNESSAKSISLKAGIEHFSSGLLPQDKLSHLTEIRQNYGTVMFVGDGINDTPVLTAADVGGAMANGTDAAIETSDVVFLNNNVLSVPEALRISKKTVRISRQNVIFAIAVKFLVILLGITGIYSNMWLAVFADTGVAIICILNSIRLLYKGM